MSGTRSEDSPTALIAQLEDEGIAAALLTVARAMNQSKSHSTLCRNAGVDLDRSGAALLYKLYTEGDDIRLCELAERLEIESPAVTRKVQLLEREGFLSRSPDPSDARAMRLSLTEKGRRSIEKLLVARQEWLEEALEGWSNRDRADLSRLLQAFALTITGGSEQTHDD
jgi:DNA-binding MarR family transcriptional regulator